MKRRYALLIPAITAMFGCASPVPVAENFPLSYQKVARTAHHWDVVADDVVSQTLQAISEKQQLQGRGIFVPAGRSTAFNTAFRDLLITRFVDSGAAVSVCRNAPGAKGGFAMDSPDVEVQYETQIISHADQPPYYRPGELTILASGVAVAYNVAAASLTRAQGTGAVIGLAALADWGLGHVAAPTRTEVIVTTTIAERNRFVVRRSDIYYVPDGDAKLFVQRVARQSVCSEDMPASSAAVSNPADVELARQEQMARDMRRVNPEWRGPTQQTSWSY